MAIKSEFENDDPAHRRAMERLIEERKAAQQVTLRIALVIGAAVTAVAFLLAFFFILMPIWGVWNQGQSGRGELARAEQNRQIAEYEARATVQRAQGEAQATIERARGESEANRIIGESLSGEHGQRRLRYLQIEAMRNHQGATIYVPTEAGIPITEAQRDVRPQENDQTNR